MTLDSPPIRIGLVGLDTSHVPAFTKLFHDPSATGDLAGFRVVAGFPDGSDTPMSRDRIAGFTNEVRELGVEIVVRGTKFENDVEAQSQIVDYFREKKVSAIVITPLHKDLLVIPVEAAGRLAVDLVAMGTRGRTGLEHLLLGSTAERVVQRSPCPALTVRGELGRAQGNG